jgi:Zn finger protein HypA/HybF involved in hydrogenase expression
MTSMTVKVPKLRCLRCDHEWVPRKNYKRREDVRVCPNCHSPYWFRPREGEEPQA